MTGEPGANGAPRSPADEPPQGQDLLGLGERERDALLAWVGENLTLVRQSASGQRVLYRILAIGFVIGLAADIGGFLLKTSYTTEPLALVGDLLYTLGWALWTGAVVVVFVQIYPELKKRQYQQALDAYEAAVGNQARPGGRQAPDPATEEAVAKYREMAEVNPGRYRPDLAQSLTSHGARLSALGRLPEALSASEEAVAIRRELAEVNPGRYRPDLAASLANLAVTLSALGRVAEALSASEEAVALYRELAEANPGRYRPDLAQSLANLGIRFRELGRLAEALSACEEAVALYRELAEANAGRYRPDLAWSLRVLADCLDLFGRGDDASVARSEAVALIGDSKAGQSVKSSRRADRPVA